MLNKIEYFGKSSDYPQAKEILISKRIVFEERLRISADKPDIEYLSSVKMVPLLEKNLLLENQLGKQLFLQGKIDQELIYQSKTDQCMSNFKISFCTFLEIPNYLSNDSYNAEMLVEYIELRKISTREIAKSSLMLIWVAPTPREYLKYQLNYPYKLKIRNIQNFKVNN